jgi:hypothetical protein
MTKATTTPSFRAWPIIRLLAQPALVPPSPAEDRLLSRNKLTISLAVLGMILGAYGSIAGLMPWALPPGLMLPISLTMLAFAASQRRALGRAAPFLAGCFALSAAVLIGYGASHGHFWQFCQQTATLGLCLGLCWALASRTARQWGRRARVTWSVLATWAAMLVGGGFGLNVLHIITVHLPLVCDAILYRMDATLGLNIVSHLLADTLLAHHLLWHVTLAAYEYNLLFTLPALLSEALFTRKATAELGVQLFAAAMVALPFYWLTPALGPVFFFAPLFPDHLPAAQAVAAHLALTPAMAPRNAMPSVHFTWALLFWLAVRDGPSWHRALAGLFLVLTIMGTLGFGEHYAVDLISAFPFTLFIRGLCCASLPLRAPVRAAALACGLATMGCWAAAIRLTPALPFIPDLIPTLALFSLLSATVLELRLYRAERRGVATAAAVPA